MKRPLAACVVLISVTAAALAASGRQPAPPGSFEGAPPQYTRFSTAELMRGFLALAFGSDLRIGARPRGVRRFDHPIKARVIAGGSVDRVVAMQRIIEEYARAVPNLHGSRGFARGLIFTRDGTLVASVAQEGLVRQRRE